MDKKNLFTDIPDFSKNELIEEIMNKSNFRIEKIVSFGNSSPQEFWYDQQEDELVFLLKGSATLEFSDKEIFLKPGDYIFIPAHTKHRINKTDRKKATVWLALFFN